MSKPPDERPIHELEQLRASPRSQIERQRARRRILAAAAPLLARRRPATSWDVLAGWARPGLVAASVALAISLGAVRLTPSRQSEPAPLPLDEVLVGEGGAVMAVLVGTQEPDADALLAAELMEPRAEPSTSDAVPQREQR